MAKINGDSFEVNVSPEMRVYKLLQSLFFVIFVTVSLICSVSYAEITTNPNSVDEDTYENNSTAFYSALSDQRKETSARLKELRELTSNQKEIIQDLQLEIKAISKSIAFPVWISILLGSVSVIIVTLGVVLTAFSFMGFNKLKSRSQEIAEDIAMKTTKDLIPKSAEKVLKNHIEEGGFNALIEQAVDKVVFSNMKDPETEDEQ